MLGVHGRDGGRRLGAGGKCLERSVAWHTGTEQQRVCGTQAIRHFYGYFLKDCVWLLTDATSKVAQNHFTRHLAAELEGTGVTANVIHPGDVKTEMWA